MASSESSILGVDIGGTKVAAGLVDRDGKILQQTRAPMHANGTAAQALQSVTSAMDALSAASAGFHSIGICAPGPLDPKTGIILNPPNLPCWRNFPLAEKIASAYHLPVKPDNDGNAAALAETRWGTARGYRFVFYACIGTGIGTGLVFDGRIYHGRTGSAAEGGHVSIDYRGPLCNCGKRGCIEALASGTAIGARARNKLSTESPSRSSMLELVNGNLEAFSSEIVGRAYAAGDPLGREILEETVEFLALWLSNIVDLIDPDILVLGGGVAIMLQPLLGDLRHRFSELCVNPRAAEIPLLPAHYGADSGIAGGAALCFTSVE